MKKILISICLPLVLLGSISAANAQTISFTGTLKNNSGQSVGGATVVQAGYPSVTTTSNTNASNNFTLPGLPANTPFSLKMSKQNFLDSYTSNMSYAQDSSSTRPYTLFTTADVSQWSITAGKGVITGRVTDQSSPAVNLDGVVVCAASGLHPIAPYTVVYPQDQGSPGSTSTATNGKFMVLNVDDGDTVTVTATKTGWTFPPKVFVTHANGISQGALIGTQGSPPSGISASGQVQDTNNPSSLLSGVTVAMVGNTSITAQTDTSGNFTLNGLPSGQDFQLSFTKSGFVPSYSRVFNSTTAVTFSRPMPMFTSAQMASFGSASSKGVIAGRVINQADQMNGYISGATVSYASSQSHTYRIVYSGASQSTAADGKYTILDIEDGDTVTVNATKSGWTFQSRTFVGHADGVGQGTINGTGSSSQNNLLLCAGWNFVSFPKLPADPSIASVLSAILSDVKVVWGFDNTQQIWNRYKPGAGDNTLTSFEQGKGYWIFLAADHTLDITNWTSSSSQVHLNAGWNLVGYSGTNGAGLPTALTSVSGWQVIWGWIGSTWKAELAVPTDSPIPPLSDLEQGKAYWIKMGDGLSADWNQ